VKPRLVPPEQAWEAHWKAAKFIEPCREVARVHGYALAEHGSRRRDIDWIAVPWVDDPGSPRCLVDGIVAKLKKINSDLAYTYASDNETNGHPGLKPQGRLTWLILVGGHVHIDLSIVPPR
jgi:hypothetical protein